MVGRRRARSRALLQRPRECLVRAHPDHLRRRLHRRHHRPPLHDPGRPEPAGAGPGDRRLVAGAGRSRPRRRRTGSGPRRDQGYSPATLEPPGLSRAADGSTRHLQPEQRHGGCHDARRDGDDGHLAGGIPAGFAHGTLQRGRAHPRSERPEPGGPLPEPGRRARRRGDGERRGRLQRDRQDGRQPERGRPVRPTRCPDRDRARRESRGRPATRTGLSGLVRRAVGDAGRDRMARPRRSPAPCTSRCPDCPRAGRSSTRRSATMSPISGPRATPTPRWC